MKCYQHANLDNKKVIDREVKAHFDRVWDTLAKALDACYLVELHTNPQIRFGKKRLKRAWLSVIKETEDLRRRLMLETCEEIADATNRELKRIGVDLDEWYREYNRERHR